MLSVRWLHVLGMAIVLGGSVVTWSLFRTPSESAVHVAERYEWLFWPSMGVIVATGVGNLGALAPAIPSPESRWGFVLTMKLLVVLFLLVFSVVRTVLVHRAADDGKPPGTLRTSYGVTTGLLLVLLAFAEVLAHGA